MFLRSFFKRQWPLIGLGGLLLLVAFYLAKSSGELSKAPELVKNFISGEGLRLNEIHYTQDDPDEGVRWVLDAREVKFSGDRTFMSFFDFKLKIEPDDRPWFELTGKRGDYSRSSGEIKIWGDLEGHSENGYTIFTDHVQINEKRGQLTTDKPVEILGPLFTVKGRGLFADLKKDTVKILSDVTTMIKREARIL